MTETEQETKCEEDLELKSTAQEKEMCEGDMNQKPEEKTDDSEDTAQEAENPPSEKVENTSMHPASENKIEEKSSEIQEDAAAKDVVRTDEVGREAKSSEEDESSTPAPNEKTENKMAMVDNAEAGATTAAQTMEMKMELSEGREALSCEEAPVADADERPREDGEDGKDGEDRLTPLNAEATAGNSMLEESGGTKRSGDTPNAERDDKEKTAAGGETEQSVQTHDEVEEKPEGKDEGKQTDPDIEDGHSGEDRREEDNETKTDANVGGNENKDDEGADGTTDQSLKTNEGEDSECVKDGNEEDENEATDVGEKMSETCGAVKKDETRAEQTESGENTENGEKEEEGGILSTGEQERNADSAEEMKKPEGSTATLKAEVEETVKEKGKGEIDAENREISPRAESVAQGDAEGPETVERKEDEIKTEEEEKDSTAESGDATNKHKGDQMDPTPKAGSGDGPGIDKQKETEQEESCNHPEQDDEILVAEVLTEVATEQSSAPVPLSDKAPTFDISIAMPEIDEHPLSAITDLTAIRGESGETEPSKATEEGTSVVLNPQASFPDSEECRAAHPEITEIANTEGNVDLVSNWVTTHQVAKFFETFVEPLDDMKETQAVVTQHDQSGLAVSPVKLVENTEQVDQSSIFQRCEKNPFESEDEVQVQEETEVVDLMVENEPRLPAGSEGSGTSLQNDKVQEGFVQNSTEQDKVSTPGAEDKAGSHYSVTRDSTELQPEQEDPDLNGKPTPVEEFRDPQAPAETEHHSQLSIRGEEPSKLNGNQPEHAELWGSKEKVTGSDFTVERAPEEPEEPDSEPPDTSNSGETTDVRLIPDLRHSKDRLSVSSVNETHFGRSSYPLLAAVRTQNGQ